MRQVFLFVFVFFTLNTMHSQDEVSFKLKNQFYLKGDAFYIGNNILSKNSKTPYTSFSIINDDINMQYIDVDSDPSTFSSSKSSFSLKDNTARVISATLYWSAVYPYAKGGRGVKKNTYYYKKNEDRFGDYTQIKFKTPSNKEYLDIKGSVLFDGIHDENYNENAPYVCYADVTHIFSKTNNGSGEYTVANIRATEGYVSGGSAAGWFLFIVYESDLEKERYITAFDGFSTLSDNFVDIEFKDFKTKNSGDSNATIFVATLEGDSKLIKDQCGIYNSKTKQIQYFGNSLRSQQNFFNGKMTIDNRYFTKRKPNGPNTLGFDVLKLKLSDKLIESNQTSTTLRLESRSDRFYFYFTAFKTEISKIFYEAKTIIEQESKEEIRDELFTAKEEEAFKKILKEENLKIPGLQSGFYIITNVFSIKSNADNWQKFLISKGHRPEIFQNPENNWYYVYIYNDIEDFKVYKRHQMLEKLDYFKEIWVFKIN
ncbi:MAG: hypothetical protein HKO92_03945 [Flavobacteriaceae bacterium]|nr:hypothetical protein [Flavobacteriaceae bacterium]